MSLKTRYQAETEIPAEYSALYAEKDGAWVLTGVEGLKTDDDISRLQSALTKERNDHKATKAKLQAWGELNPAEVHEKLDKFDELATAADGKMDETKINSLVEARLKSRLAPLERERDQLKGKLGESESKIAQYETTNKERSIGDAIRKAAQQAKLVETALEDAILVGNRVFELTEEGKVVTREGVGVMPGLDPATWLGDMQKSRPHWWPTSAGGGAAGGNGNRMGGDNPWSADNWNVTKQMEAVKTHGEEKAGQLAKQAGSFLGAIEPAKKKG